MESSLIGMLISIALFADALHWYPDDCPLYTLQVMSRDEIVASLRDDYATNYFVSGKGDMAAYADDCEFADPFVSFRGVSRFKQNVGKLGVLM